MNQKTGNQLFQLLCFVIGCFVLVSCSNEGYERQPEQPEEKESSTKIAVDGLNFSLSALPFGADTIEGSRAQEPNLKPDTVELCEGVSAEVTLEREHLPATRAVRRALPDGDYFLFANQGQAWHYIAFKMQNNKMISHSGSLKLAQGYYNFYCFNDKIAFSQADNKFYAGIANAGNELFGVARDVYVSGVDFNVTMLLTRLTARVKVRLSAMMDFPGNFYTSLTSDQTVANIAAYDIATNQYYAHSNAVLAPQNDTYVAAPDIVPATAAEQVYGTLKSVVAQNYHYVFMGTSPSHLYVKFNGEGQLYGRPMSGFGLVPFQTSIPHLLANGSYVIRMRLVPNFRYLLSDNRVDYLRNKGNAVPIALRVGENLGIALTDAAPPGRPADVTPTVSTPYNHPSGGTSFSTWADVLRKIGPSGTEPWVNSPANLNGGTFKTWMDAINYTAKSGSYFTWDPNSTRLPENSFNPTQQDKVKGNTQKYYPAFYWADLARQTKRQELYGSGVAYSELAFAKGKWYLPTVNEWYQFLANIGFCAPFSPWKPDDPTLSKLHAQSTCYSNIIDYALRVAGGASLWDSNGGSYRYWTCCEYINPEYSDPFLFPGGNASFDAFDFIVGKNNSALLLLEAKYSPYPSYWQRMRVRAFLTL